MNPYFDASFFDWFFIFIKRLQEIFANIFHGKIPHLYSDEIQVFALFCFSTAASFFGVFLLLKRLTMMANALSHTMLLGIVFAYLISLNGGTEGFFSPLPQWSLFLSALLLSLITVGLVRALSASKYMTTDAANGMTFTFLFALGVTFLSLLCKNAQIGTDMVMGNVDLLTVDDLFSLFTLSLSVLCFGFLLLRGFLVSTFDPVFAFCSGMKPALLDLILYLLVGIMSTFAFKAVGFILALSFFVIPPLTARLFTHKLLSMIFLSQGVAMITCFIGVALSRHLLTLFSISVSTSALIATLLSFEYVVSLLFLHWRSVRKTKYSC